LAREMELNRALLFQGEPGGLKPVAQTEQDVIGYGSLGHFALLGERGEPVGMAPLTRRCAGCHGEKQGRNLITQGTTAVPLRATDIDSITRWREQNASLDRLCEFIARKEPQN